MSWATSNLAYVQSWRLWRGQTERYHCSIVMMPNDGTAEQGLRLLINKELP